MRLLLEREADIDMPNNVGVTPLMNAVCNLKATTVQLLLAHGLMIGAASLCSDNTAFHCACSIGDACVDCVELLVRAGCDTSLRAKNGETGKDIAERLGNTAVLYKLRSLMLENMPAELPTVALL